MEGGHMRKKILLGIVCAMASVFIVASVAIAQESLTLSASSAGVTYPHSVRLTVGFPDSTSGPATAAILAQPVGEATWTTLTVVATTATPTVSVKPLRTTAYQASFEGTLSAPVTVTVAARLTKPTVPGSLHLRRTVTIKGTMSPAEASGTVSVSFYRIEPVLKRNGKGQLRKSNAWVFHSSVDVPLKVKNSQLSTWSMRWKPSATGHWKVVVRHSDDFFSASSAYALTRVRS
jgi:hypothetical protein